MFLFLKEHKTIIGACVLNCVRAWCVCVRVCVSTCDSSYRIPSFLPRPSTAVCACALAGNADMLYERCFYKLQSVFVSPYTNLKLRVHLHWAWAKATTKANANAFRWILRTFNVLSILCGGKNFQFSTIFTQYKCSQTPTITAKLPSPFVLNFPISNF